MKEGLGKSIFRRYPALAMAAAAAALAILLPSALTVPNSGPSQLAEFAPVPGEMGGRSDISALSAGRSGSAGIGSGAAGAGEIPGGQLTVPKQSRSSLKRCVGTPPRQTEDPLSPPCVAFFEGDNGGATARGVSKDEVKVGVRMANTSGDSASKPNVDCAKPVQPDDNLRDVFCKSYMRYFNDRYQTYNRRVHLWSSHGMAELDIEKELSPFAYVAQQHPSSQLADKKVFSTGYDGTDRPRYQRFAPYLTSFRADLEDQARIGASYICTKLVGRTARYSGTPTDRNVQRKFALWYSDNRADRDRMVEALNAQCGLKIDQEQSNAASANAGAHLASGRFRSAGVTTVIMLLKAQDHVGVTTLASQSGYFPEWVIPGVPGVNGMDTNFYGRLAPQAQWSNAFGITFDYRRNAIRDQPWYRAYREGCPDCPEPSISQSEANALPYVYDSLTMLFYGIQAAGPRLNADNIDKGMHAIPQQGSANPYKPAAYFASGNYSYLKDAMMIYWDVSGTAPGSSATGCYRLPLEGRRFRPGDWIAGDGDVRGEGPCQGDVFTG